MYINRTNSLATMATLVKGYQKASGIVPYLEPGGTIKAQLPHFKRSGLDLEHCYHGTLNLGISPLSFRIVKPFAVCKAVTWSEKHAPEDFYFARAVVRSCNREFHGCVYYPDPAGKVQHFHNESTLEVLAPFIDGVSYGSKLTVEFDIEEVELRRDGEAKLLHIATARDWADAKGNGFYRTGSLEKEGFIHTSMKAQVLEVANRLFAGRRDLVLLTIDPRRLGVPVAFEEAENGQIYPHIFGTIALGAVVEDKLFMPDGNGTFSSLPCRQQ
jgi:uncharacterized protein (DUF952 family)